MSSLTVPQIKEAIAELAKKYDAEVQWGTEDGFTWLTIFGENISPKIYDILSQEIANAAQVNFYFASSSSESIEGALDAQFKYGASPTSIPELYSSNLYSEIENYGQCFSPISPSPTKPVKP